MESSAGPGNLNLVLRPLERNRCWVCALFLLLLVINNFGSAQVQTPVSDVSEFSEAPAITWLGEISNATYSREGRGVARRLIGLFAGKKQPPLVRPFNMALGPDNRMVILDQGSQSIKLVDQKAAKIQALDANNLRQYPSLVGICLGSGGELYWSDSQLEKIFTWKPGAKEVEVFSQGVELKTPAGIAFSSRRQELWVLESQAHRISVMDMSGKLKHRFGRRGEAPGEFNYPIFIWIDQQGRAYVVDSMNFRVQIFDEEGRFISSFGKIGDASGYLARPKGIATDSDGHIYIVDALFHNVQIFDISGRYLANFGLHGNGQQEFWLPAGIFIDRHDRIYVADSFNQRVQIYKYTAGETDEY